MEALLEAKEPGYTELLNPIQAKLRDLQNSVSLKAAQPQITRVLCLITGVSEPKALPKPSLPLQDLDIVIQKPNIIDLPIFETVVPNTANNPPLLLSPAQPAKEVAKPNAFTFINQPKRSPVTTPPSAPFKEEIKATTDIFANLKLKPANEPVIKEKPAAQSSFAFVRPPQVEKKSVFQGLDLDFAATDAPAQKPSDLLSSIDLGGHFENVPVQQPRIVSVQPQPYFVPGIKPALIPQSLYMRGEAQPENRNDDKYFGFVNEEFGGHK